MSTKRMHVNIALDLTSAGTPVRTLTAFMITNANPKIQK
ncbi:hypothetical protein FM102_08230 [Corynebacterium glutamicum]|nr:hypothetical protein FM102_08230 [Corynebacterium glutamicum]